MQARIAKLRVEPLTQQLRHHLTRFAVKVIVCSAVEFGQIRIHLNDARASPDAYAFNDAKVNRAAYLETGKASTG
jgi:hypothetical protein